ncbi:MAG: DUF1573 domain-containing protein [Candidatus Aminicenantes bacterium]|nr:DUF1573 domain-containing protein [Candidatus Aminicenantes bacterium]
MNKLLNGKSRLPFVLILTCFLFSGGSIFAGKGPKIKFREESKDFGKMKQGKVLTHIFVFKNEGDETLVIKRVKTSCGCTAALLSKKEIAPGAEGEIKLTYNTKGYEGKNTKYIDVESNDPAQPRKRLTVSAEIEIPPRPRIFLDRYAIDLGLVLENEEIQAKTKVKNRGELELRVNCTHKRASFYSGGEKITFPLKIAAGKEAEVEIRIPPSKRKGVIREYVVIKSNDPLKPNLSLYFSGYIATKSQLKELFAKYKDILE